LVVGLGKFFKGAEKIITEKMLQFFYFNSSCRYIRTSDIFEMKLIFTIAFVSTVYYPSTWFENNCQSNKNKTWSTLTNGSMCQIFK